MIATDFRSHLPNTVYTPKCRHSARMRTRSELIDELAVVPIVVVIWDDTTVERKVKSKADAYRKVTSKGANTEV